MIQRLTERSNAVIFFALAALAFIIRISFLQYLKFDGLYGQDTYAYYDWSREFITYISNFQIPPKFFYWPVGYFIFSAVINLLCFGSLDTSTLMLSLLSGSLLAGVMYLLTFELLKNFMESVRAKKYSILAGLIICFAGSAVKSSIVVMSDSLGLVLLTSGMLFFVKYYNKSKRIHLIFSFMFFSLGVMVRYANALIILAVIICLIYIYIKTLEKKVLLFDTIIAALAGLVFFIPEFYYITSYGISYFNYEGTVGTWATAWNPVNFFRIDFITFDGANHYRLYNGLFFLSPVFHPMYLLMFGLTSLWGMWQAVKKKHAVMMIFCFSWIVAYYLYFSGCPYQSIRYTLSYFPPLIVFSVFGLSALRFNYRLRILYVLISIILLAGWSYHDLGKLNEQKQKELEVVSWVNTNITGSPLIYSFAVTGALNHYTGKNIHEFFNYNESKLTREIDSARGDVYFILPAEVINTQWSTRPLKGIFDFVMTKYKPVETGKVDVYTIYRIDK